MKGIRTVSRNSKRKQVLGNGLFHVLLAFLCVIACFPLLWMFLTSLKDRVTAFTIPPVWIWRPTFEAYHSLLIDRNVLYFLMNSVLVAFPATAIALAAGALAGYSLARYKFAGKKDFAFWFLVNRMIPPLAIIIPVYMIFVRLGLLDTRVGLIWLYTAMQLPFVIWMMRAFFEDIPREIEEMATVDGASWFTTFTRITLPLSAPGLVATSIFIFILSWNEFAFAFIITTREAKTLPPVALTFMTEAQVYWNEVGAAAVIISIPMILFALVVHKYLVRGLTMGAIR